MSSNTERNGGVKKFTRPFFERRPPTEGREVFRDKDSPLSIRIPTSGRRRFIVRKGGRRFTYNKPATIENLVDARRWALVIDDAIENEKDINQSLVAANFEPVSNGRAANDGKLPKDDFERVMNWYLNRFIYDKESRNPKPKRSAQRIETALRTFVLPRFKGKRMVEITRTEINELLDDIAAGKASPKQRGGGVVAADRVLQYMAPMFKHWAVRDATFLSPIVPGMIRKPASELRRDRYLKDNEIRMVWHALDELPKKIDNGYSDGAKVQADIIRMLFLSGCRVGEVTGMRRNEIEWVEAVDFTGWLWTIPGERYKNKRTHEVPLTRDAVEIIERQSEIVGSDLVFTLNGKLFQGTGKLKSRINTICEESGECIDDWRFHDIRHTVKTLLRREGVSPFISERVLGHTIRGIEGVYDHYTDRKEKAEALDVLSEVLAKILKDDKPCHERRIATAMSSELRT